MRSKYLNLFFFAVLLITVPTKEASAQSVPKTSEWSNNQTVAKTEKRLLRTKKHDTDH